jgi:signal transduction histidine kinase
VRKDGKYLDISLTISPLKDSAGRVIGASKVARDITDKKQAERDLRESQERLRTLADELEIQVRARTNELKQRNEVVLQQSEQLRELSNRLLRTQDEERRRIARDLHDSAGQIITVLGMNLAGITQRAGRNGEIRKAVEESHELVHQLSKEIRTLSYLLHPPLLDETGLADAILLYMKGLEERSGLKIQLCIPKDFERLPDDMELAIFRIVQEGLTNIHRHSGSKTATIRVSRDAENVFLEIEDEGTGISDEKLAAIRTQRAGVGFTGMRERIRHLRGILNIQSSSNGTKISVTFPVSTTAISAPDITGQRAKAAQ